MPRRRRRSIRRWRWTEVDTSEWTAKAMTLLRAIQAADAAYKRELGEAFDRYRRVITTGSEERRAGELHALVPRRA